MQQREQRRREGKEKERDTIKLETLIQPERAVLPYHYGSLGGQTLIISDLEPRFVAFDFSRDTWLRADQTRGTHLAIWCSRWTDLLPKTCILVGRSVAHRLVDISSTWRARFRKGRDRHIPIYTYMRANMCRLADVSRIWHLPTCSSTKIRLSCSCPRCSRAEKQNFRVPSYLYIKFNLVIIV